MLKNLKPVLKLRYWPFLIQHTWTETWIQEASWPPRMKSQLTSHEVSLYPSAVCDQDLEQDVDQEKSSQKLPKRSKVNYDWLWILTLACHKGLSKFPSKFRVILFWWVVGWVFYWDSNWDLDWGLDGSTKTLPSQNTRIHNCVVCLWELKGGGTGGFSEAMLLELQWFHCLERIDRFTLITNSISFATSCHYHSLIITIMQY